MTTLIYDFETSGLNPYHDDVTEIGCKCLETNEHFTCLVQPLSDRLLSDENQALTGITNKMLKKDGLLPLTAYKNFFDYLLKHFTMDTSITMVAHNGKVFDDIFLKRIHRYLQGEGYSEYDVMMEHIKLVDSLLVSRLLHPERYAHSMKAMCKLYNIKNEAAHRAMGDVDALTSLWTHLMNKIKSQQKDTSGSYLKYILYY
jgi:DNA polymerase III alpha subunit (gram-positive type)